MSTKIYRTWCDRIDAPEMAASHIRQFRHSIAGYALGGDMLSGHRSALTADERLDLWERFQSRVLLDGGPLVSAAQAEQGRQWLHRYAKKAGLPTFSVNDQADIDYLAIARFRFVGVMVVDSNTWRTVTAPIYECEWDGKLQRLRYAPYSWMSQAGKGTDHWWVTPKEKQLA